MAIFTEDGTKLVC